VDIDESRAEVGFPSAVKNYLRSGWRIMSFVDGGDGAVFSYLQAHGPDMSIGRNEKDIGEYHFQKAVLRGQKSVF